MKKLDFLIGKWTGDARVLRGPGVSVEMIQTEEAHYKLDGLVLLIEGIGRAKSDGRPVLQALGMVSFDDGCFLETEVKLLDVVFPLLPLHISARRTRLCSERLWA